jgi:predicted HTH domain antitoxin
MQLSIPESIIQSIRLPEGRIEAELLKELAIALYAQELLSFGKARALAKGWTGSIKALLRDLLSGDKFACLRKC